MVSKVYWWVVLVVGFVFFIGLYVVFGVNSVILVLVGYWSDSDVSFEDIIVF